MSAKNSNHYTTIEEEKRKFDLDLRDIEKRISRPSDDEMSNGAQTRDEDEKTGYELME
jgi:hypothetical protein